MRYQRVLAGATRPGSLIVIQVARTRRGPFPTCQDRAEVGGVPLRGTDVGKRGRTKNVPLCTRSWKAFHRAKSVKSLSLISAICGTTLMAFFHVAECLHKCAVPVISSGERPSEGSNDHGAGRVPRTPRGVMPDRTSVRSPTNARLNELAIHRTALGIGKGALALRQAES